MCALLGWYLKPGAFSLEAKTKLAEYLVPESDKLGGDSWGCAIPQGQGRVEVRRGMGNMADRCVSAELATHDILYGHCRRATSGAKTLRNSHPFCVDHIIGAHNGMVHNHARLDSCYPIRHCEVDSKHIFHHLAQGLSLEELDAWGVVWFIRRHDPTKLNLFRSAYGHLAIRGLGKNSESCYGIIFATIAVDAEAAAEAMESESFMYSFDAHKLYFIKDGALWDSKHDIAFGEGHRSSGDDYWDTHGSNTGYTTRSPLRLPPPSPMSRELRTHGWSALIGKCDGCLHYFTTRSLSTIEAGDGRFCPDCRKPSVYATDQ